jgi:hypothetical protein
MTIVVAKLDLEKLGLTLEQFTEFAKDNPWYVEEPKAEWSDHIRDLTTPWEPFGTIAAWKESVGPFKPGVYALVYDPDNKIQNPILHDQTIIIGESTQQAYRRLVHHAGALRGNTSNMSDKYRRHMPKLNKHFGVDLRQELKNIRILFRPHDITDPDWAEDRDHSSHMETQAHAMYYALWEHFPPGNTRDLPSKYLIERSQNFLKQKRCLSTKTHKYDLIQEIDQQIE